jgi:hypothetical protein
LSAVLTRGAQWLAFAAIFITSLANIAFRLALASSADVARRAHLCGLGVTLTKPLVAFLLNIG